MTKPKPGVLRQIVVFIALLAAVTVIAVLGSMATIPNAEGWYLQAEKVPWNPAAAVFGPVWSVLYVMIAVAGFLIWRAGFTGSHSPNRSNSQLWIYATQLALNGLWTPIFFAGYPLFGHPAWLIAMVVIVALIVVVAWLIISAKRVSKLAAWMLVPYLLWIVYASTLNAGIIALN